MLTELADRSAPALAERSENAVPPARPGVVPRPRLLRRLLATGDAPIAMVVAPAGYGKTTLLMDWAMRDPRPFAWISLTSPGAPTAAATELVEELGAHGHPHVVVVDDAHLAADRAALRRIADLACRLPAGSVLALASRKRLPMAIGRLRASRMVVELGAEDLAMTPLEAALLLDAAGVRADGREIDVLVQRTGGWPVGLYLAALSICEQPDAGEAIERFGGSDRFVAEYVRDEILAELSEERVAFLRRTSILSRLTASLCDAVLDRDDSAPALEELARGNVLVEPLDRTDREFRYHPLLAEALRAELARSEPRLEPALHRRAADWHRRHGEVDEALAHVVACRDAVRAGRLLWSLVASRAGTGRAVDVRRRLRAFGSGDLREHPALALTAAATHLAEGRCEDAEHAIELGARALDAGRGSADLEPGLLLMRACLARDGAVRMGQDAERACAAAKADSGLHSAGRCLQGIARHLAGDRRAARPLLEDAARCAGPELGAVAALAHGQLALLAIESHRWDDAARHADAARAALVEIPAAFPAHALVLSVHAVLATRGGDLSQARRNAKAASRLLASLDGFVPWYLAETQIWLARAEIRLSDAETARALLSRAARNQSLVPDAPLLGQWLHETWERADAFAAGSTGAGPALTNAELRVLRMLPSHLTFREIGGRLQVSSNTIKTQAISVYRKLDVTSRSEAVARGRAVGLIDG